MSDHSFEQFYRDSYRRVVVGLRLATGSSDLAEDLAQEAYARTLIRWSDVNQGSNPVGYVYRTAFRLHRRSAVRRLRHRDAAEKVGAAGRPGSRSDPLWDEAAVAREVVARLPLACRRVAALCLYAEMTAPEAAEVLGISASTVRTQLQRARQALVAALDGGPEPSEPPKMVVP